MNPRKYNLVIGGLVTAGGTLLSVVGVKDRIDRLYVIPAYVYDIFLVAGLALLVLAVISLTISRINLQRGTQLQYVCSKVEDNQLEEVHTFCREILGDDIGTMERLREWHNKNPDILHVIYAQRQRRFKQIKTIVGFFSVFPVTTEAKQLLSRNALKGTEFNANHITARGRRPAAIYIGAVAGNGFKGREQTLMALMGFVTSLTERKTSLVFTRPISDDGLRLAKQYGFTPAIKASSKQEEGIFVRDFSKNAVTA